MLSQEVVAAGSQQGTLSPSPAAALTTSAQRTLLGWGTLRTQSRELTRPERGRE